MNVPKASVNDLLVAGGASNPSATLSGGPNPNDPMTTLINTIMKYANPVVKTVQNIPQDVADVANKVGPAIAQQQVIPNPVPGGPKIGPSLGQTVDAINSQLPENAPLPGTDVLKGATTPMGLLALGTTFMGGGENPEEGVKPEEVTTKAEEAKGAEAASAVKPDMITKNKADPYAIARMETNFRVPRAVADNMPIKPDVVLNQLAEDKITGRNLDDLQNVVDSVTGGTGAFPLINNHILQSVKEPISYGDAQIAATTGLQKALEGEKPSIINDVSQRVKVAMRPIDYNTTQPENANPERMPVTGEVAGAPEEGKAYASDLFQVSQNLRDIQQMYLRKAYTGMGDLNHPEYELAANAIGEIKNNIDDALNKAVPAEDYQKFKSDPFVQRQLQRVPQTIANRWLQGADSFKDGQKIQAPYVNLDRMITTTKDSKLAEFTQWSRAMQQQQMGGGENFGAAVAENTPGPKIVKNVVGGVAKAAASPFLNKSEGDIFQENMKAGQDAAESAKMNNQKPPIVKSGVAKAAKVIGTVGGLTALGAGLESLNHPGNASSSAESQNGTNKSDNSHTNGNVPSTPLSVKDLNTNVSSIDVNSPVADPRQVTGSDGKAMAIDPGTYTNAITQLEDLKKTDPSYITNPIKAGQLAAAETILQTKQQQSKSLMDSYQNTTTLMQKINDAKQLLTKTSPWVTDAYGFLEGAHKVLDPNYLKLVNDFKTIENMAPSLKGELSDLSTKDNASAALDQAAKIILAHHNQILKNYEATPVPATQQTKTVTSPTGAVTTGVNQQEIPQGLPAPTTGGAVQAPAGSSYQFTPPNPLFQ